MELDCGDGDTTLNILKKHIIVHLNSVNFMVYELYLSASVSLSVSPCVCVHIRPCTTFYSYC